MAAAAVMPADDDRALLRLRALLSRETPESSREPGRVRSEPLRARRRRPPAAPDDPAPEVPGAGACRFCAEPVDPRDSGGDVDGGWSHLSCWVDAGHPDVGW